VVGGLLEQDDRTHPKKCLLAGQVGERGIKLRCGDAAMPTDRGRLEVNKAGNEGKIYTTYVPMAVVGTYAESAAESFEAGDRCWWTADGST
jgi:hypothetical protein